MVNGETVKYIALQTNRRVKTATNFNIER